MTTVLLYGGNGWDGGQQFTSVLKNAQVSYNYRGKRRVDNETELRKEIETISPNP